jgi:hypothetical protein
MAGSHGLVDRSHLYAAWLTEVNVCVCVCMFPHNYLSVNGRVSFPSFT